MRRALTWSLFLALGTVLALATTGLAPLPSTLDTGNVLDARTAQWENPHGPGTNHGVTGDDVTVYTTEGVNQHPDLEACLDQDHHTPAWINGHTPWTPIQEPQKGHGTLTAGVLCGDGTMSNEYGLENPITGVAPDMRLFSFNGICIGLTTSTDECAQWFAENDIRVMSHSINSDPTDEAKDRGAPPDADVLFVQSAGNSGGDGSTDETDFPHDDPRVMGIANAYADGSDLSQGSSRGDKDDPSTWPHLAAPGCTYTTALHPISFDAGLMRSAFSAPPFVDSDGRCATLDPVPAVEHRALQYHLVSGTSFSAPYVAGVAAMLFEVHPQLTALDAKHLLTRTADPFLPTEDVDGDGKVSPEEFWNEHGYKAGYGLVNATAATAAAHYMALNPNTSPQDAVDAYTIDQTNDGTTVLNPEPAS